MKDGANVKEFYQRKIDELRAPKNFQQFDNVVENFTEIRDFINEMIEAADSAVLTSSLTGRVNNFVNLWNGLHERIRSYEGNKDAQTQFQGAKSIVSGIQGWYNRIFEGGARSDSTYFQPENFLTVYNTIKSKRATKIDVLESELANQLKSAKDHAGEMEEKKNDFVKYIDGLKTTVNEKVQESGVSKFGKIFLDESKAFGNLSIGWIVGAAIVLMLTISSVVLLSVCVTIAETETLKFVQYSVIKVLIISGGFYALSVCMKNYRAYKHNEVLNKHRHNALTTFEAFTKSTEDPHTKNAILLEATHTIFGNQNTGYNNVDSGDGDFSSKVIEFIRPTPEK